MSADVFTSFTQRVVSLEDIIRQQEQTIGAVLQRLRDVEQYAVAESRNREQAQQQLYALWTERGGASAETGDRVQTLLQSHNDRISALQAEVQGQTAALRGVAEKQDMALRGIEQRLQADLGGVHQRAQTSETASTDAIRALQMQLQNVAATTQAMETRNRDDLLALQQQTSAELASQRQRGDNLENALRDALREIHGSLSGDVRSAGAQHRTDLESAVQRINQALEALDQRTRTDLNQLHATEQNDVAELRRRVDDYERGVRDVLQAATNGLSTEVAQVAQHSQALDKRQSTAHQAILQELAKHDAQLESVDLSWRASVTDLIAKLQENVATAQQQFLAGDQALQRQVKSTEDRLESTTEALRQSIMELAKSTESNYNRPLSEAQRALSVQEQLIHRLSADYSSMQDFMKTFSSHVDDEAAKLRLLVESAVRAAHSDLLERISVASAAIAMGHDPEAVRAEVNRGMAKLWDDAKGAFLTPRDLSDVQSQMAHLESAVRVELCALAERNNEAKRSIDELRLAQLKAMEQPFAAAPAPENREAFDTASYASTSSRGEVLASRRGPGASPNTRYGPSHGTGKVEEIERDGDELSERLREQEEEIRHLQAALQALRSTQALQPGKQSTESFIGAPDAMLGAGSADALVELLRRQIGDLRSITEQWKRQDEGTRVRVKDMKPNHSSVPNFPPILGADLDGLTSAEATRAQRRTGAGAVSPIPSPTALSRWSSDVSEGVIATPKGAALEVPGTSTGEKFYVRRDGDGRPLSALPQLQRGSAEETRISPTSLAPGSLLITSPVLERSPTLGGNRTASQLSEVLLPTQQFVRKREMNTFKEYAKHEFDKIWEELLNARRNKSPSKEEVLLYIGQSKEQVLNTILQVVRQHEKEVAGTLAIISERLSELTRSPAASRDVKVFPMEGVQQLEELMRTLAAPPQLVAPPPPTTTPTTSAAPAVALNAGPVRQLQNVSQVNPATRGGVTSSSSQSKPALTPGAAGQSFTTPVEMQSDIGSLSSSDRSSTCLQPRFISPVVHRHAGRPAARPDQRDVLAGGDASSALPGQKVPLRSAAVASQLSQQPPPQPLPPLPRAPSQQQKGQFASPTLEKPTQSSKANTPSTTANTGGRHSPTASLLIPTTGSRPSSTPTSSTPQQQQQAGNGEPAKNESAGGTEAPLLELLDAESPLRVSINTKNPVKTVRQNDAVKQPTKGLGTPRNRAGGSFHLGPMKAPATAGLLAKDSEKGAAAATATSKPVNAAGADATSSPSTAAGNHTRRLSKTKPPPPEPKCNSQPSAPVSFQSWSQNSNAAADKSHASSNGGSDTNASSPGRGRPSRGSFTRRSADSSDSDISSNGRFSSPRGGPRQQGKGDAAVTPTKSPRITSAPSTETTPRQFAKRSASSPQVQKQSPQSRRVSSVGFEKGGSTGPSSARGPLIGPPSGSILSTGALRSSASRPSAEKGADSKRGVNSSSSSASATTPSQRLPTTNKDPDSHPYAPAGEGKSAAAVPSASSKTDGAASLGTTPSNSSALKGAGRSSGHPLKGYAARRKSVDKADPG